MRPHGWGPWYIRAGLRGWPRRREAGVAAIACVLLPALLAGCGGGNTVKGDRQDTDEPSGNCPVAVEEAAFPLKQELAETSKMRIVVRNAGDQ